MLGNLTPTLTHVCRATKRRQYDVDEWVDAFDLPTAERLSRPKLNSLGAWHWKDLGERIAYKYFCWRYFLGLSYHAKSAAQAGWLRSLAVGLLSTFDACTGKTHGVTCSSLRWSIWASYSYLDGSKPTLWMHLTPTSPKSLTTNPSG